MTKLKVHFKRIGFLVAFITIGYAQNEVDSLRNLIVNSQDDTLKIMRLNEAGSYIMFNKPDTAILVFKRAHEIGSSLKEQTKDSTYILAIDNKLIKTNNSLGITYQVIGDYKKSLEYLFRSLELSKELKNPKIIGACLNNIGLVYWKLEERNNALSYFNEAVKSHQTAGNDKGIASVYNNIGMVFNELGRYNEALEKFLQAKELNERNENMMWLAANYSNIGETYSFKKMYPEALVNYQKAVEIEKKINYTYGESLDLGAIGVCYLKLENYTEAEKYIQKALELGDNLGAIDLTSQFHYHLSDLYSQTHRFELALEERIKYETEKDSMFNSENNKQIGRIEAIHEMEIADILEQQRLEEQQRNIRARKRRKNLLQYSGIVVFILFIGIVITLLGYVKVNVGRASSITFFSTLVVFEFTLLLLDPIIDKLSYNEPAIKLIFNMLVAVAIVPIHNFLEKRIKKRLMI